MKDQLDDIISNVPAMDNPMETVDNSNLELLFRVSKTTVPGVSCVEATTFDFSMAIGFIWFRQIAGEKIEILYVFTLPFYQRRGVASKALDFLETIYFDMLEIVSEDGSESGEPWMLKNGFTRDEKYSVWVKEIKKPLSGS